MKTPRHGHVPLPNADHEGKEEDDVMTNDEERRAFDFLQEVVIEWRSAAEAHAPMVTVHEAAAVIKEEYDEFWDEVKRKSHHKPDLRTELTQVAAMCLKAVVDLELQE